MKVWIAKVKRYDGKTAWAGWISGSSKPTLFSAPWQGKYWLIDRLLGGEYGILNEFQNTFHPSEIKWLREAYS